AAELYCRNCGRAVRRDSAESIYRDLCERARAASDPRLLLTFPVPVPENFSVDEVRGLLERQGYTRFLEPPAAGAAGAARPGGAAGRRTGRRARRMASAPVVLEVIQDRLRAGNADRARVLESLEAALRVGR